MTHTLIRKTAAEFVGTYALVVAGCGAIMADSMTGAITHMGIALTFGLIIAVMVAAVGHISMAHFNPAVTVAFALTGHFPWREVPAYLAGQFGAAVAGALTLRLLLGDVARLGATLPQVDVIPALGIEAILTAILMFVIIAVATDARATNMLPALAIGGAVALDALWGGPLTGASMNPARSFGPALVSGAWDAHWVYWVGPIIGAAGAAWLYELLRGANPQVEPNAEHPA